MDKRLRTFTFIFSLICGYCYVTTAQTNPEAENSTTVSIEKEDVKVNEQPEKITHKKETLKIAGLKPGDVAPDAKIIDADSYEDFHEGIAVIKKGNKSALINSNGEFVLNFSDLNFGNNYFENGAIIIDPVMSSKAGFVNRKGKIITMNSNESINGKFRKDGKVSLSSGVLIDTNGIKAPYPGSLKTPDHYSYVMSIGSSSFNKYERISFYSSRDIAKKFMNLKSNENFGICDWNFKFITPLMFNSVTEFSEGLAAVSQIDEFGKEKWGYVDEKGKLIIPYTYTNKPGKFKSGLALIEPVDKSVFEYAYIDRENNIKIKLKSKNSYSVAYVSHNTNRNGEGGFGLDGEFTDGYSWWTFPDRQDKNYNNQVILDTTGAIISVGDFFKKICPEINIDKYGFISTYFNKEFYIKDAIINVQTGKISYTVDSHYFYDNFSGLARASVVMNNSGEKNEIKKYRNGYVDKNGIFKIVISN